MNWSLQQDRIFSWFAAPNGNLVVRARAGTGKTTTIVEAIQHIGAGGPGDASENDRILLCAFNKRVQEELTRRVVDDSRVDVKTLHALGFMYLKAAWGPLTLDATVEDDRIRAIEGDDVPWEVLVAIKKLIAIAKGAAPFGDVDAVIDLAAAHGCEVEAHYGVEASHLAATARQAMTAALECDVRCRITFDDMLYVPVVNKFAVPLYDWVVVDEAQDMNASQLLLAQAACKPNGHIVIVGDDRQAIYKFRGADSDAIDRLKEILHADELNLTTTYRCPRTVVEVAAKLVPDFQAAVDAPDGEVVTIEPHEVIDLAAPGDVILSRTNAPLVPLCLSLIRNGTPARIEGRDIGKMLADRVRKLKAQTVEEFQMKLNRWARTARGRAIARERFSVQRCQEITDIEDTLGALMDGCTSMQALLQRCEQLFIEVIDKSSVIVLSSIHKAKGLEWARVFLLTNSLYCYGKRRDDQEEANLEYVAVTRAKETLVLVGRMRTVEDL